MALLDTGAGDARSKPFSARSLSFRRAPAGRFVDWHPAPRAQFIITLHGEQEIEMSDGEKRLIGPGDILLAADTEGKGHIMRGVGSEERLSVTIPLNLG